jgi:hypothetical protein
MDTLNDSSKMQYGKHIGETLREVPAPYLLWLRSEFLTKGISSNSKFCDFNNALKLYIEDNLDAINLEMGGRPKKR